MKVTMQAFLTGLVLGAIFSLLNLPIPAPPNFAGVMGAVGIFVGFVLISHYYKTKKKPNKSQ